MVHYMKTILLMTTECNKLLKGDQLLDPISNGELLRVKLLLTGFLSKLIMRAVLT